MSTTLRIGLVGAGNQMRHHVAAWRAIGGCEPVAVCDLRPDAARRFAEDHGIARVCADAEELAAQHDVDIVDIATPNRAHLAPTLAALAAGKHVVCEKPLATTTAEVLQLADASRRAGRLLMSVQNLRWTAEAQAAKQWAASGALGAIYHARVHALRRCHITANAVFNQQAVNGGGATMDIGVHALDMALWLMGHPTPQRVSGLLRCNFGRRADAPTSVLGDWDRSLFDVDDHAVALVHFADGSTLHLEVAWMQHQVEYEDFSAQLFGSEAGLHWPSLRWAAAPDRQHRDGTLSAEPRQGGSLVGQLRAFVHAVHDGLPSPVPVAQSLDCIAILEAIARSSRLGREVAVGRGEAPAEDAAAAVDAIAAC